MCHASSIWLPLLSTIFVGMDGCYMVFELSTTQCILSKISKTFLLRVLPDLTMHLRAITPSNHKCVRQAISVVTCDSQSYQFYHFWGEKSLHLYVIYIHIYSWKKLFEKIVVEMVKLVEVPSYHTNSLTTFADSHEFLLLWEKHEGTVWQYTGIHLPKPIHPYTRNIYRACIKKCWTDSTVHAYIQVCQKMHEHGHVWYWTVNDAVT